MKKTITTAVLLVGALSLTACASHMATSTSTPTSTPSSKSHFVTPAGVSYKDSLTVGTRAQQQYVANIQNAGGGVVRQGNVLTIILPNQRTFSPGTTKLAYGARLMFPAMVSLLKTYEEDSIAITGYSPESQKIAAAQAKTVQNYLWSSKAYARMMISKGIQTDPGSNEIPRVEVRAVLVTH